MLLEHVLCVTGNTVCTLAFVVVALSTQLIM
jgi:hypothetical protein